MLTMRAWLKQFGERFNEEELNTGVYKAIIQISTINKSTGNVEYHRLNYDSKESSNKG